jgi:hypothetical protein
MLWWQWTHLTWNLRYTTYQKHQYTFLHNRRINDSTSLVSVPLPLPVTIDRCLYCYLIAQIHDTWVTWKWVYVRETAIVINSSIVCMRTVSLPPCPHTPPHHFMAHFHYIQHLKSLHVFHFISSNTSFNYCLCVDERTFNYNDRETLWFQMIGIKTWTA